jgi:hypothetical protein
MIMEDVVAKKTSNAKKIPQMTTEISMGLLITVKRNPMKMPYVKTGNTQ